jgi:hypothetical protein
MEYIFFIIWCLLFAAILFGIFSRRGRNILIRMQYGGTDIEDLGIINKDQAALGQESVRLLRCKDGKGDPFFVVETRTIFGPSVQFTFARIDKTTLDKLNELMKPAGR